MEEQFYLAWPPILALLLAVRARRKLVVSILGALVLASGIGGWLLYAPHAHGATPDVYFSPVLNVAPLLTGCILAIVLATHRGSRAFRGRLGTWCTWVGLVAVLGIQFAIPHGWQGDSLIFAIVLPVSGLATAVLLAGLVSRVTVAARVLAFSPIAWFGRNASYSLYLWHVLLIALLAPIFPGLGGKFIVFGAAAIVAIGSHYAIERPFLALKNRLEPRAMPVAQRERELAGVRG